MTEPDRTPPSIWTWENPRPGELVPDSPPVDLTEFFVPGSASFYDDEPRSTVEDE